MPEIGSLYPLFFLIESIFAVIVAVIIYRKNPSYYLNQFFIVIVLLFANYIFWESMIYFFYTDLALINLFKDISLVSSHLTAFLFFVVSVAIWYGKDNVPRRLISIMGLMAIGNLIIAIINEKVVIENSMVIYERYPPGIIGQIITFMMPMIFVLLGAFLFFRVYPQADENTKRNLRYFLLALSFLLSAIAYFAVLPILEFEIILGEVSYLIGSILYFLFLLSLLIAFWKND